MNPQNLKYLTLLLIILLSVQCKKKISPSNNQAETRKGDYYVATNGDDNNPGTQDAPFKTIKKGVKTVSPGQTLIIKAGNYDEFIFVEKGGTNENERINILSEKIGEAKCKGFRIFKKADYITINGFEITSNDPNYAGIVIYGNSYIEISDCHIYECPSGAIRCFKNAKAPKFINNNMEHNGFFGIYLDGNNGTIHNNTISRTVQFHPDCNPAEHSGADADGIVIFGHSHTITANKIINIGDPNEPGNIDPHADCIQTSKISGNTVLTNSIIANNYFNVNNKTGKGIIIESYDTECHDIIIYNNIFEIIDIGIAAYTGKYSNIKIANNVFKTNLKQKSWGTAVFLKNVNNYEFINNITIDCKTEHRKIIGGNGIIENNIAYNSDNSKFSMTPKKQESEITGQNPNFVNYTGKHGENDYHLQKNSIAIDKGKNLNYIIIDKDYKPRPQGDNIDIGPYEYE